MTTQPYPRRILVTGGAGFIGSNFIHHVFHKHARAPAGECCPDHARYDTLDDVPDLKVLNVDNLTYAGDLRNLGGIDQLEGYRFLQADICDVEAMHCAMRDFQPDAIVHFAAESHVDRSIEGGEIFVRTNVLGNSGAPRRRANARHQTLHPYQHGRSVRFD